MHQGCFLRRISMWNWMKQLCNQCDFNIWSFYNFGELFCQPVGENTFSKSATKTFGTSWKYWPNNWGSLKKWLRSPFKVGPACFVCIFTRVRLVRPFLYVFSHWVFGRLRFVCGLHVYDWSGPFGMHFTNWVVKAAVFCMHFYMVWRARSFLAAPPLHILYAVSHV